METMATKKEYINTVRARYAQTKNKTEQSKIIDEVVCNLGKTRKHVIKILNGKFYYQKRRRHVTRPEKYPYRLHIPLARIWEVAGKPCSKNLKPNIGELVRKLEQFNEIKIQKEDKELLCQMSSFTIDKLLKSGKHKTPGKGICGTKKSPLLKSLIPIRTNFDDVNGPGH